MPGKPTPFTLPFPVKGVDRSMPIHTQPDLTCPDALNVRAFPALTDNAGGGSRPGTVKEFTDQAGEDGARRINALKVVPRTVIENVPISGDYESVRELWSGYNTAVGPATFAGAYTCYTKLRSAAWSYGLDNAAGVQIGYNSFPGLFNVTFTPLSSATAGAIILAINYPTRNRVRVRLGGNSTVAGSDTSTSTTTAGELTYCGPIVRGAVGFTSFFVAYLQAVGPNSAQLVIDKHEGGVVTRVGTSQRTLALKGINGGSQSVGSTIDMVIELSATPSTLRATVSCPSAMTPSADSLLVENNTDLATQTRGGVWNGMGDGVSSAAVRFVLEMQYERLVPRQTTVYAEVNGATWPPAATPNQYYLPDDWGAAMVRSGAATTVIGAGYDSASLGHGTPNNEPVVERTGGNANTILGGQDRAARTYLLFPATVPTERRALEMRFRDISSGEDSMGFCCRIHTGSGGEPYSNMIKIMLLRRTDAAALAINQSNITEIKIYQVVNGAPTALQTTTFARSGSTQAPVFSTQQPIRFYDDGTTITLSVNGMVLWSITQTALAALGGYNAGADDTAQMMIGVDVNGSAAISHAGGVRIVKAAADTVSTVAAGTDVVIFTPGYIDVGDRSAPTVLNRCAGDAFSTATIQADKLNNKLYAVDGSKSLIIDPISRTVSAWKAERGTFPERCSLVAIWRGRGVLARRAENTSQWSMSRVQDLTDFDYGSTSVPSTKAYTGTTRSDDEANTVGAPPDAIVALIPFGDSALGFFCENSIHVLEGDPGAGGVMQVKGKTGIVGPNAWCFGDEGALYFLGSSGLYVMSRVTFDYQPIGHRRLVRLLDRVDLSACDVVLRFRKSDQTIHIFMTPRDGSVGTHVVYQPPMDAFWLDRYPARVQPTGSAELGGETDEDRTILLGGVDGYVRRISDAAKSDDGDTIESFVRFEVFDMGNGTVEAMATELQGELAVDSGALNWHYLVGDSAEAVNRQPLSAARRTGTWVGGFNYPDGLRESGPAHQLVVRAVSRTAAWALQRINLKIRGERRRR